MSEELQQLPMRLAMRHEGNEWVAYISEINSMKKAVRIGSISIRLTERPERKDAFFALMRECMLDMVEDVLGFRPVSGEPTPAPESERSGHG